jgi:hypothetical protein
VSVDVLESTLVDTTKGFSVSTEPAPSEKNTGELKILLAYPNNQPISGKTVDIYTQKMDLNNQPVRGERVKRLRTDDTGILTTELEPGTYALRIDAARGEDWGKVDNVLPFATQLTYNVTLGRIRIESRDDLGNVTSKFYTKVAFPKLDNNNNIVAGNTIAEGSTDDTGIFNYDLTPGTYVVVAKAGEIKVDVKSGETITVKNSDFGKP